MYFNSDQNSQKIILKGTLSRKLLIKIYEDYNTLSSFPDAKISVDWSYNVANNRIYYEQVRYLIENRPKIFILDIIQMEIKVFFLTKSNRKVKCLIIKIRQARFP